MTLPYQKHSETSIEAAIQNKTAQAERKIIYGMIINNGVRGMTNDDISAKMGKNSSFYSPRLIELERDGHIVRLKETRKTRANRSANLYVYHNHVNGREVLPVKQEVLQPEIPVRETDRAILNSFIYEAQTNGKVTVRADSDVYHAIQRIAGL